MKGNHHEFINGMKAVTKCLNDPDFLYDMTGLCSLTKSFKEGSKTACDVANTAIRKAIKNGHN